MAHEGNWQSPRFTLGRLLITPAAQAELSESDIELGILRHSQGDWGVVDAEDRQANEVTITEGTRILSSYLSGNGTRFWIITEADRSATTVLLPDDY